MLIRVTLQDIAENPTCPVEPALKRLTGQEWLVGINCAERRVEIEEDGEAVLKTEIIDMPQVAYDYIAATAQGEAVQPIEFEVGEARLL